MAEKLAVKSEEETVRGKVMKLGLAATDDEGALWRRDSDKLIREILYPKGRPCVPT